MIICLYKVIGDSTMNIFQAIFLGIVQGLTELLPVSSSAHLNIMPWAFNWTEIPDYFDLALHAGTLFAILIYFFKDWIKLICGGYKLAVKKEKSSEGKLFWYILFSTVPAGIVALVLDKIVDKFIGDNINLEMGIIAAALIIMGIVLYIVDKKAKSTLTLNKLKFKPAFLIGVSQALAAAFPGVSRSGITMTVARANGLDRESAARFSFLLSAPMVAAAVLVKIPDFKLDVAFILGVLASFLSGLLVIGFLMKFLKKGSFKVFAIYRVLIGVAIYAYMIIR